VYVNSCKERFSQMMFVLCFLSSSNLSHSQPVPDIWFIRCNAETVQAMHVYVTE